MLLLFVLVLVSSTVGSLSLLFHGAPDHLEEEDEDDEPAPLRKSRPSTSTTASSDLLIILLSALCTVVILILIGTIIYCVLVPKSETTSTLPSGPNQPCPPGRFSTTQLKRHPSARIPSNLTSGQIPDETHVTFNIVINNVDDGMGGKTMLASGPTAGYTSTGMMGGKGANMVPVDATLLGGAINAALAAANKNEGTFQGTPPPADEPVIGLPGSLEDQAPLASIRTDFNKPHPMTPGGKNMNDLNRTRLIAANTKASRLSGFSPGKGARNVTKKKTNEKLNLPEKAAHKKPTSDPKKGVSKAKRPKKRKKSKEKRRSKRR